jgi:hypothetical protein
MLNFEGKNRLQYSAFWLLTSGAGRKDLLKKGLNG